MAWDVLYYDDNTGLAYRVRVKRLSMRDGARLDQQIVEANRATDDDVFSLLQQAAYIENGTAVAQRAPFDAPPTEDEFNLDGGAWADYAPTVDDLAALDELFAQMWYIAVLQRNPHRNSLYEALKKSLMMGGLASENDASSSDFETSETPSAAGTSSG